MLLLSLSLSLQVKLSNHSSIGREDVVTIDKLQYLRQKICTLIERKIPNTELLAVFEELGKDLGQRPVFLFLLLLYTQVNKLIK